MSRFSGTWVRRLAQGVRYSSVENVDLLHVVLVWLESAYVHFLCLGLNSRDVSLESARIEGHVFARIARDCSSFAEFGKGLDKTT